MNSKDLIKQNILLINLLLDCNPTSHLQSPITVLWESNVSLRAMSPLKSSTQKAHLDPSSRAKPYTLVYLGNV